MLPADNPWNTNISKTAVAANSARYVAEINGSGGTAIHPDFGSNPTYGIPYQVVPLTSTSSAVRSGAATTGTRRWA